MARADLIEYARAEAGDLLRAVGEYHGSDRELLYLRDDLDRPAVNSRFGTIVTNIQWAWNPNAQGLDELGEKIATVEIRETTVILHIRVDSDRGILIGLEPAAARQLTSFVGGCIEEISEIDLPA